MLVVIRKQPASDISVSALHSFETICFFNENYKQNAENIFISFEDVTHEPQSLSVTKIAFGMVGIYFSHIWVIVYTTGICIEI